MSNSISLLLGAGFSAPAGYPVGNQLNQLLLDCDGTEFGFSSEGILCVDKRTGRPDSGFTISYDIEFDFCRDLIQYYHNNYGGFDYERFYDFLLQEVNEDKGVEELAQPYLGTYHTKTPQLIDGLRNIYNQMVAFYLADREGNKWYTGAPHYLGPNFPGYTGFLKSLAELGEHYNVNVHTLNHDLFFERLNRTDFINGQLCDGFEEIGSPFYGILKYYGEEYKVKLSRFTGNYPEKFRLYKLHGSLDYCLYYKDEGAVVRPYKYIKTLYGIGFGDFKREIENEDGILNYEDCWVNYHADFLTGTTSKIERYKEPLLFEKLFSYFQQNLQEAENLIIVGYGGRDDAINQMISENFDFKNKPSFIVDPYPGKAVNDLKKQLNAGLVTSDLESLQLEDIT